MGLKLNRRPEPPVGHREASRWTSQTSRRAPPWALYVELATRVAAHPLEPGAGSVREALDSLHSLFGTTREVLREAGADVAQGRPALGPLAIDMLNKGLRPFVVRWHTELGDDDTLTDARREAFDQELATLQSELAEYVTALAKIAQASGTDGGVSPRPSPSTSSGIRASAPAATTARRSSATSSRTPTTLRRTTCGFRCGCGARAPRRRPAGGSRAQRGRCAPRLGSDLPVAHHTLGTIASLMLPPVLEIYVVWHPADHDGRAVADRTHRPLPRHAFSGLIGGAIEVFVRSEGWSGPGDAPRPLPSSSPSLRPRRAGADGRRARARARLAAAVEHSPARGRTTAGRIVDGGRPPGTWPSRRSAARAPPRRVPCIDLLGRSRASRSGHEDRATSPRRRAVCSADDTEASRSFISHTKHGDDRDAPLESSSNAVRRRSGTPADDFFDAQRPAAGRDWGLPNSSRRRQAHCSRCAPTSTPPGLVPARAPDRQARRNARRDLDALACGEDRGSFLMDHVPRIPLRGIDDDAAIHARPRAARRRVPQAGALAAPARTSPSARASTSRTGGRRTPPSRSRSSVWLQDRRAAFRPATPSSFCTPIRRWVATNSMPCARSPLCRPRRPTRDPDAPGTGDPWQLTPPASVSRSPIAPSSGASA